MFETNTKRMDVYLLCGEQDSELLAYVDAFAAYGANASLRTEEVLRGNHAHI